MNEYNFITANRFDNRSYATLAILVKCPIYETPNILRKSYLQAWNDYDISICTVYIPPSYTLKGNEYNGFSRKLRAKFFGGDFYAKHQPRESRLATKKFNDLYKTVFTNFLYCCALQWFWYFNLRNFFLPLFSSKCKGYKMISHTKKNLLMEVILKPSTDGEDLGW